MRVRVRVRVRDPHPHPHPHPKQEGDRLLPVVMATQGGDAGLAACDVVIEVDGERGLSAEDTKRRLEERAGPPLQLRVRRAALRSKGCKLGPPAAQLEGMAVRTLVQCLMLYPQVRPAPVACAHAPHAPVVTCPCSRAVTACTCTCQHGHAYAHVHCACSPGRDRLHAVPDALPSTLYPLPSPLCPLPSTLSPLPSPLCPLPSPLCPLPSTLYPLPSPLCPLPSTLYPLPSTLYPLPSTLSPLPSPLCPLPSALCPQDAALQYAGAAVLRGRLEAAAATPDARRHLTQQAAHLP